MIGQTLGRYRFDSVLGEGGMGKVYKAWDESLGRSAAVKILPSSLVHDADRLQRFIREARAASGLNHPNVVTIYEVGQAAVEGDGTTHYIAMELVEGDTLRERLTRGRLDLARALDLMAQVADGVATAHRAGVVHRDLKPENIVISRDGFAKILDFGLAKLREVPGVAAADGATEVKKTTPGAVLGTVGYMSPEQARGDSVDERSDIFSLGCILYECVTGSRAFQGDSSVDTMHKILYSDPPSLAQVAAGLPPELQRIVRKCLAKEPDQRYQSAKDLVIDLRDLRREIESTPRGETVPVTPPRRNRAPWIIAAALTAVAVLIAIALTMRRPAVSETVSAATAPMSITRLTSSGKVIGAVISPDGEYLSYAYSDAGRHSIWLRQIATGSAIELVPPFKGGAWGLQFSPDSRSIYYAMKSLSDPGGTLSQIPILGGQSRKVLQGIDSHARFSPDGKRMLFLRNHSPKPGHGAIVIADTDGANERVLIAKAPPAGLMLFWGAPAWSPDGQSVVFPMRSGTKWTLMQVDVATGREAVFSKDEWASLGDVNWLPDGSGLLAIGSTTTSARTQVWLVSREGQRKQITNDFLGYRIVSLSADGTKLVSVGSDSSSSIWRTPLDGSKPHAKLADGKYDGRFGVAMASDGTLYFTSNETGTSQIWSLSPDGQRRQVTMAEWPALKVAVSPDQRFLLTTMPRQKDWVLARFNLDGSGFKVLCTIVPTRDGLSSISFTRDSRHVIFDSAIDGVARILKVPIDSEKAIVLREGDSPSVSPDGSRVAYLSAATMEVAPLDGNGKLLVFENVTPTTSSMVRWAPDGKGILHNAGANDRINIWYQPLDGSEPHKVTRFDDEYVHRFEVTPDGKDLIAVRGTLSRDAVLFTNFR